MLFIFAGHMYKTNWNIGHDIKVMLEAHKGPVLNFLINSILNNCKIIIVIFLILYFKNFKFCIFNKCSIKFILTFGLYELFCFNIFNLSIVDNK